MMFLACLVAFAFISVFMDGDGVIPTLHTRFMKRGCVVQYILYMTSLKCECGCGSLDCL